MRSYSCFGVHPNRVEVGGDLVAQHALDHVEIVINQRRRLAIFGAILDLLPQALEEPDVGAQLFFARALRGGTDDEAAHDRFRARSKMIRFRRCRSSSEAILRETPMWFTVGM